MSKIPIDTSCEAEYEDGFILSETEQNDQSAYIPMEIVIMEGKKIPSGPNTLNDILERRPEAVHGKMVRFAVFYNGARYDINWRDLPDNARPIRFRDRSSWIDDEGRTGVTDWHGCRFGYQYTDENGKNVQQVEEL